MTTTGGGRWPGAGKPCASGCRCVLVGGAGQDMRAERGADASSARATPHGGACCPPEVVAGAVRDLLAKGHGATFRVAGVSMRPTIREGDLVALGPLDVAARPGEIIMFARGSSLCLHRVLSVVRDEAGGVAGYVTAGDGLLRPDGFQPASAVAGRVLKVHTRERTWSPQDGGQAFVSRARVLLAGHPRLRTALRRMRAAVRRAGAGGGEASRA